MKALLATDGSANSREAEWFLNRVPFPKPLEIDLATVVAVPQLGMMRREFPRVVGDLIDEYHANAQALLAGEASRFEGIDGVIRTHVLSGHPAEEIVNAANQLRSDLVVLGARGHTATQRFLLGSVSLKVAKHAPCSVLVLRSSDLLHDSGRQLRIVVAHDGSLSSSDTIRMLSSIHWGECVEIRVVSVMIVLTHFGMEVYQKSQELWQQQKQEAELALAWAVAELKKSTPNVTSILCQSENAADAIVGVAEEMEADIIVMGERGRSRHREVSAGEHFPRSAGPCTLFGLDHSRTQTSRSINCWRHPMIQLKRILAATDFSEYGESAVRYACEFAGAFKAELCLLNVVEPPAAAYSEFGIGYLGVQGIEEDLLKASENRLKSVPGPEWEDKLQITRTTAMGTPFIEIVRQAREQDADMIVIGTHGRGAIAHMLLGGTAEKVIRKAPCPVLTVRAGQHEFVMP